MFKNRLVLSAGFAGVLLVMMPVAGAADDKTAKDPQKDSTQKTPGAAPPAKPQAASPGMVVVKDSVTGQLRAPTADEFTALTAAKPKLLTGAAAGTLRTIAVPGGGTGYVLDDSTTVFAVATKTPDGKVKVGEVTGADAAKKAVKTAPATKGGPTNEK